MKRSTLITFVISAVLLLFCNIGGAQTKAEKIHELLTAYQEIGKLNGSALVSEGGKVIHKAGYGMANMEWEIPNESDTKHRLGSITKQFTAMLITQLAQEGKVDLHKPITTYVPNYKGVRADEITLHHLLTHTSGIPNYTSFPGFFQNTSRDPYTPEEFIQQFADSTLNFDPGEGWDYSNSGYFLLGYIVETVTGNSYEEELRTRIFDPLDMDDTGFDHHADILKKRATGYEKQGLNYINSPYLDMSIPYSAGSMYSTVEDLYKWDQALYTEKILNQEYLDKMITNHVEETGRNYGYGFDVGERNGMKTIGHGGGINGFNTLITRFPDTKDAVIMLNNTGGTSLGEMTMAIMNILNDKEYEMPKKSIVSALYENILNKGLQAGMATFKALKADEGYVLDEQELNNVGYQILGEGKVDVAKALFKLNMEEHPDSWNTYDSYAESLMQSGDKEGAIKYYTKSVEMNPGNQNGLDMLEKLGVDKSTVVKEVNVADEVLASYVGKYQLQPGFIIEIMKEGSQLKAQATGQGTIEIFPKSNTEFYAKAIQAELEFNKNDEGEVVNFILKQGGQVMTVNRIQ